MTAVATAVTIAAWVLAIYLVTVVLYRAVLAGAYLTWKPGKGDAAPHRYVVLIPAHDEELLIGNAVDSIRRCAAPGGLQIYVVADNCRDATGERARAHGARVLVRHDPENPGKGQALAWALDRIDLQEADAVAFFDADNLVEDGFFHAMDRELTAGARCLQGYYGIANPDESLLTRMIAVTYVMKNLLYNGGKAALGLSVTLMGTGMVLTREVLESAGWQAMSIGEDLEQSLLLMERGEAIRFVPDAVTRAQEAASLSQGFSQRQRWASGRRALAARARRAVVAGLRRRSIVLVDGGLDLLLPTYSKTASWSLVVLAASLLLHSREPGLLPAALAILGYQGLELCVALRLMRASPRFLASLAFSPVYLAWKAVVDGLALVGYRREAWVRTDRTPHLEQTPEDPKEAVASEVAGRDAYHGDIERSER